MPRIRTTFHYAVRGLLIEHELLGHSFALAVNDFAVTVVVPLEPNDDEDYPATVSGAPVFEQRFPARETFPPVDGGEDLHIVVRSGTPPAKRPGVRLDVLRAEVLLEDATFGAANFQGRGAPAEVWERAKEEVDRAGEAADAAIERLLAWSRVRHGQTWLGLYGEPVPRVGPDEVVDLDAGRRLPWPARLDMAVSMVEPDTAWSAERIEELRPLVEANVSPELADTLLADARFLAGAANPRDPSRALLIAAVACEVKIKACLMELAAPEQAPLVELLLENPRDWSVAAAALFHKPLQIVAGRSLKESEKPLWKRIDQLFQRRNALAHRGEPPTESEALDGVRAARDVFAWLASLSTP